MDFFVWDKQRKWHWFCGLKSLTDTHFLPNKPVPKCAFRLGRVWTAAQGQSLRDSVRISFPPQIFMLHIFFLQKDWIETQYITLFGLIEHWLNNSITSTAVFINMTSSFNSMNVIGNGWSEILLKSATGQNNLNRNRLYLEVLFCSVELVC